ncbi:hypothetical protein AQI94_31825 [Streptomyces pseudovenezuelae]|uniref:Uncharacterized protein n=1 Tax=Streptomyces pseudovenezuelae TaxID=67350 RepID=A0A124H9A5_9ACTN|nr:hypothetical protein AQI94_31825 [Streptomyces pseudovenezuelae]
MLRLAGQPLAAHDRQRAAAAGGDPQTHRRPQHFGGAARPSTAQHGQCGPVPAPLAQPFLGAVGAWYQTSDTEATALLA